MNNIPAPLKLTLYGIDNEIKRELTRSIIPFGILERALDLQNAFGDADGAGPETVNAEKIDMLTDFVVYVFDDKVTADEIKRGASITDIFALYKQIFTMVSTIMPPAVNPTQALAIPKARQSRKR